MLSLLLLHAPALFAASIYMLLSRIIQVIDGEGHSLVKRRWLTKMFAAGDVISFFVQCGGMSPSLSPKANLYPKIPQGAA